MSTGYTNDPHTTMSESEAKEFFQTDLEKLMERVLRTKEQIGGREGAREISMVYTKLQEAHLWMQEAHKVS